MKNNNIVSTIISQNRKGIVQEMKIRFQYLMDDICNKMAEDYFQKNIYYNSVEQMALEDDLEIQLSFEEIFYAIEINEDYKEMIEKIKIITNRVKGIDEKSYKILLETLSISYPSYHSGMYISHNQEEFNVEFVIYINISKEELHLLESWLNKQKDL